jgi:hypothetical protein
MMNRTKRAIPPAGDGVIGTVIKKTLPKPLRTPKLHHTKTAISPSA